MYGIYVLLQNCWHEVGRRMGNRVWESTNIRNGERSRSYGAVCAAFTSSAFVHQLRAWPEIAKQNASSSSRLKGKASPRLKGKASLFLFSLVKMVV